MGIWNAIPIVGDIINNIFDFADDNLLSKEEELTLQNARKIIEQKPQLIKLAIEKSQAEGRLKIALAQIDVNKEEAKGNLFQRSWRPALAWSCILIIAFKLVIPAIVKCIFWVKKCIFVGYIPYQIDKQILEYILGIITILLGGSSILRSWEKNKGVQNKH